MTAAHQRFSAETRRKGELDSPGNGRRRNLRSGRLSVVLGKDLGRVIEEDASNEGLAAGAFVRRMVLDQYARQGITVRDIATRAAALRVRDGDSQDGDARPELAVVPGES